MKHSPLARGVILSGLQAVKNLREIKMDFAPIRIAWLYNPAIVVGRS